MTHSIFGWSYQPGCSGPPEPDERFQPCCIECGAFLTSKPFRSEPWQDTRKCAGHLNPDLGKARLNHVNDDFEQPAECGQAKVHASHNYTATSGYREYRHCANCRSLNITTVI